MPRGGKQYKELLLFEEPASLESEAAAYRGRNPELIERRNEHLLTRLVYFGKEHPEWKYEAIVAQLAAEFYLSESTVGQIIEANGAVTVRIRREWPGIPALKKKYEVKW